MRRLLYPSVSAVVLAVTPAATQAAAKNWQSVGASPDQGVEVFVDTAGGSWCKQSAAIKIVADDRLIFSEGTVNPSLQEIGQQLASACPQMTGFQVYGYENGSDNLVFQAIAWGPAWTPSIGKAPAAGSPPAPAASSSGHASSTKEMFSGKTVYGNNQLGSQFIQFFQPNGKIVRYDVRNRHYYYMEWAADSSQRLCIGFVGNPKTCSTLHEESDGSFKAFDPDGNWYAQYTRFVSGDIENITTKHDKYSEEQEAKNGKPGPLAEIFARSILNSVLGGGGGGGGGGRDLSTEFTARQTEQRIQREMYKDWR